ncbi:uncharacterized protein LOC109791621 [Cajanus cajan]|uniref:uncharacterized protein LOC109791621 n=1 Tax=Cajanus cajan TaxID=3821 RepID=UPI00098D7C38|nr:uncharacterized protein LOC109791621 [Cajanus cajan]
MEGSQTLHDFKIPLTSRKDRKTLWTPAISHRTQSYPGTPGTRSAGSATSFFFPAAAVPEELVRLRNRVQPLKDENKVLKEENKVLSAALGEAKMQGAELQSAKADLARVQKSLGIALCSNENYASQVGELQGLVASSRGRVRSLEDEVTSSRSWVRSLEDEVTFLRGELVVAVEERLCDEVILGGREEEIAALRTDLAKLEAERAALGNKLEETERSILIEHKRGFLKAARQARLLAPGSDFSAMHVEKVIRFGKLVKEDDVEESSSENAFVISGTQQEELVRLRNRVQPLKDENKVLKEENKVLSAALGEAKMQGAELQSAKADLARVQKSLGIALCSNENYASQVGELQGLVASSRGRVRSLEDEVTSSRSWVRSLEDEVTFLRGELVVAVEERLCDEVILGGREEEIAALRTDLAKLEAERAALGNKLEETERSILIEHKRGFLKAARQARLLAPGSDFSAMHVEKVIRFGKLVKEDDVEESSSENAFV